MEAVCSRTCAWFRGLTAQQSAFYIQQNDIFRARLAAGGAPGAGGAVSKTRPHACIPFCLPQSAAQCCVLHPASHPCLHPPLPPCAGAIDPNNPFGYSSDAQYALLLSSGEAAQLEAYCAAPGSEAWGFPGRGLSNSDVDKAPQGGWYWWSGTPQVGPSQSFPPLQAGVLRYHCRGAGRASLLTRLLVAAPRPQLTCHPTGPAPPPPPHPSPNPNPPGPALPQYWPNMDSQRNVLATAQSAYFLAVVVARWADLLVCKTRKESIFTQVCPGGAFPAGICWAAMPCPGVVC